MFLSSREIVPNRLRKRMKLRRWILTLFAKRHLKRCPPLDDAVREPILVALLHRTPSSQIG
jgi:hypothetical protein